MPEVAKPEAPAAEAELAPLAAVGTNGNGNGSASSLAVSRA
jgi:hypothetical protein